MAVYTRLSQSALRRHLRPFRLGRLVGASGVSAGTINTIYDVSTTRGRYILRILEDRSHSDARFEEALLTHLAERGLPVPQMLEASGYGCVIPIAPRQQLSVFHYLPGREIGVFEVRPSHAEQVGDFLARMHLAARSLRRQRRSRYDPPRVQRILERCMRAAGRDSKRRDLIELGRALHTYSWPERLPKGIIHSDLFIDNARFARGKLTGVLDFEMACTGPWVYDLAVALCDWAFLHDSLQLEHARALLAAYTRLRPLRADESAALYELCCFAAARFALTRFFDFEVRARPQAQRRYKDYRHFMARLAALQRLGPGSFLRRLSGTAGAVRHR